MPYYPQTPSFAPPNPLSFRNILGRNGGFEVWQRGAGGSAVFNLAGGIVAYTADGWAVGSGAAAIQVGQNGAGLTSGSRYAMYVQRVAGQTGVAAINVEFPLDTDEIVPMRNSIVTLSFTGYAGANFSAAGSALLAYLIVGTGAPTKATSGPGFTSPTYLINAGSAPISGVAARFSFTTSVVVPTNATQATVVIQCVPVGTAGAADTFVIDDVQLEIGSVATPFERRPFESELGACKRHFQKTFHYPVAPAAQIGNGIGHIHYNTVVAGGGGALAMIPYRFPVSMRVAPTIVTYAIGASGNQIYDLIANLPFTGTTIVYTSQESTMVYGTIPGTPAANAQAGEHLTADAGI